MSFQYSPAELDAQVAALPVLLQWWFNWMTLVIVLMPLLFIRRPQARVALVCAVALVAVAIPLSRIVGISHFLSLPHLVLWTPLVFYFSGQLRRGHISVKSPFGIWCLLLVATCIISLVFDARDFTRWLMGERGIMTIPENPPVPWLSLSFIIVALVAAGIYIFRKPAPSQSTGM
jgi:surface polysaccharide O-acyltransferase-like enzyme